MIEGWSKERGQVKNARVSISPALVENICQQWTIICKAVLFRAAALLTFFGAFQISEVVASSKGDLTRAALKQQDMRLDGDLVGIYICQSKADQ